MKHKVILLLTLLSSHIYSQNIDLNIGEVKSKEYYEEVGFEFIKDKIIVPVSIEGKELEVVLDMDLGLDYGEDNVFIKDHNVVVKSHLGDLYDAAREVYDGVDPCGCSAKPEPIEPPKQEKVIHDKKSNGCRNVYANPRKALPQS